MSVDFRYNKGKTVFWFVMWLERQTMFIVKYKYAHGWKQTCKWDLLFQNCRDTEK